LCALRVVLSLREQPPPLEPAGQDAHRIGAELPTFGEEFDCIGAAADAFERQGEPHESVLVEAVLFGFEQVERALEVQRLHRDTGGVSGSPRSGSSDEPVHDQAHAGAVGGFRLDDLQMIPRHDIPALRVRVVRKRSQGGFERHELVPLGTHRKQAERQSFLVVQAELRVPIAAQCADEAAYHATAA
jgi:hypothetical protein